MSVQISVYVCVYRKPVVWKDCSEEKGVGISVRNWYCYESTLLGHWPLPEYNA